MVPEMCDIVQWFKDNKNPDDKMVHAWAEKLGVDAHELEKAIYDVLSAVANMKGSEKPDSDFDTRQLELGTKVETEHLGCKLITKDIAKGHLLENRKYYDPYLKDMESKMEREAKARLDSMVIGQTVVVGKGKWSGDVKSKWNPPEGFFKQSADKIASGLKRVSKDLKQAMSRLNFYLNRAGKNLSATDKKRIEGAKDKLRKLYEKAA